MSTSTENVATLKAQLSSVSLNEKNRSDILYSMHPEVSLDDVHFDGHTHKKLSEVYALAAQGIAAVELKLNRDITRAINPYFAEYSDEQIDAIIAQQENARLNGGRD